MNPIANDIAVPSIATPQRALTGWIQLSILLALTCLLYFHIFPALVSQWIHDPNYSHGFLVPLFAGWVVWKRREQIVAAPRLPHASGLLIVAFSMGVLCLGVLGAENFLARTSFLFLLAGLIVYFFGWACFRAVLFPWAVLFLAVPIPVILLNKIAFPLQFLASRLASGMLAFLGVPVLREGNVIHLPSLTLDVVEACSGLRSLVSLITLSVFYGYLFEPRPSRRIILILSSIPIAVFANGLRIMGSGLLGEYVSPTLAEGFFHTFSGWLIFVLSLLLLLSIRSVFGLADKILGSRPA
ncbi:MAG TPA: exosortase/archaeosortase family protein [Verrucomicrobiae bacterium]|nr:exosortase/archaeosortase family protein [Verrucomicrobiae bacterium]